MHFKNKKLTIKLKKNKKLEKQVWHTGLMSAGNPSENRVIANRSNVCKAVCGYFVGYTWLMMVNTVDSRV